MANDGSISCALRNSFAALGYSKLCSCASPRRNGCCADGAPELAKATTPTSSCAAPAVNAKKSARSVARERMGADGTLFNNLLFGGFLFSWGTLGLPRAGDEHSGAPFFPIPADVSQKLVA